MLLTQKLSIVGGSIITFSVVFGFVAFDQILRFAVKDQTSLRKRNEARSIYLKLPFPMDFRVYFFNVSNPMEVQKGAIPILEEIGPYCYDEYTEKIDIEDNDGEDSLTYSPYAIFNYNQEKSGSLKDDDYVTILHPLVVGMVNQVNRDTPALLPIVNKAIGLLFPELHSIYLTAKVKEILFDGLSINCKVSEFPAKATCTQMKTKIPGLKVMQNEIYMFSILGTKNATVGKRVKVSRGISVSKNLGKMMEIQGTRELNMWGGKECNALKGTDGWIFPTFLTPEEGIWSYSTDLCRSVFANFTEDAVLKGINVRRYEADLGDMEHNDNEKCFCDTPRTCLKKGVFDLSKCMGVPIYATLPHFLRTEEIYLTQVKGMEPVMDNHIIQLYVEPMTTVPIEAYKRLQFNFLIAPNNKIDLMKNIPEALHPVFWVEESVSLEGALLKKITNIFLLLQVIKIVRWIGVAFGVIIVCYGTFDYFVDKKGLKITPVHQTGNGSKDLGEVRSSSKLNISGIEVNRGRARSILNGHEFDRY